MRGKRKRAGGPAAPRCGPQIPCSPVPPLPSPPRPRPQESTNSPIPGNDGVPDPIPLQLRKAICVYEAGKVQAHAGGCAGQGQEQEQEQEQEQGQGQAGSWGGAVGPANSLPQSAPACLPPC
jgi:hypothetical protein